MSNNQPDEIDLKILSLLQGNARMDIMEVVRRVNLTKTPVTKRIRKLKESGFIKSYNALLDREKIGQPVLVVTHIKLEKQTSEHLKEFENTCKDSDQIQFCLHVSGTWTFILHVTAATPQDYYNFIIEKFSIMNNVCQVESCFVMKECKSYGAFAL